MELLNTDISLVEYWFQQLRSNKKPYCEPILTEYTVIKLKLLCDNTGQDSHVFLTGIEMLEEYIRKKNKLQMKIDDPLLVMLTIMCLACKYTGDSLSYKTKSFTLLYEKLTNTQMDVNGFKLMEIDVINTLDKLPLSTQLDDMKTFLMYVIKSYQFRNELEILCENLLNFYKMHETRIFVNLKIIYMQNLNAYRVFKHLLKNRLYVLCGVIICAFRMLNLELSDLLCQFSEMSRIHSDHLQQLAHELFTLYKAKHKLYYDRNSNSANIRIV